MVHDSRKGGFVGVTSVIRISKNTPATTIVDLWRSAETGVGPSIAAGNQGCNPNWADFPIAASRDENRIMFIQLGFCFMRVNDMLDSFHFFEDISILDIRIIIPMSPIRL